MHELWVILKTVFSLSKKITSSQLTLATASVHYIAFNQSSAAFRDDSHELGFCYWKIVVRGAPFRNAVFKYWCRKPLNQNRIKRATVWDLMSECLHSRWPWKTMFSLSRNIHITPPQLTQAKASCVRKRVSIKHRIYTTGECSVCLSVCLLVINTSFCVRELGCVPKP